MDWDGTLLRLLDSNESIELRKFARQGVFTNAETKAPHITQLITDIEPEEYCLFTAEPRGHGARPTARAGAAHAPSISAESLEGLSIDDVCSALDELARMFPQAGAGAGVENKTAYYRTRAQQLANSIVQLEDTVERQRRELIEYNEMLSALSGTRPQSAESVAKRIHELEAERDQLTEKLAGVQQEVDALTGRSR